MRGTCSASRGASCPTAENQLDTWQRAFEPQALSAIVDPSRSREHMNSGFVPFQLFRNPRRGKLWILELNGKIRSSGWRRGRPELVNRKRLSSLL